MHDVLRKSYFDMLRLVALVDHQTLPVLFVSRRVRNRTHGGVGGRGGNPASYPVRTHLLQQV